MSATLDSKRELLRHLVATLAYRGGIAVSGAPENFSEFRAGENARSAGELLAHIVDLLQGSLLLMKGEFVRLQSPAESWAQDVRRFFTATSEFDSFLVSSVPLAQPVEKIVQGPIADALTHVGQIVLLRRLAGKPIRSEGYFEADIKAGEVVEKHFSKFT